MLQQQKTQPVGPVVRTKHVTAELISENTSIQPGSTAWVALYFRIIPKWHTYWRNAGDSGEATQINWTLPKGFSAGKIVWLPPSPIKVGPLLNYGYTGEAIHMVPIQVPKDAKPGTEVTLAAKATWLVCEDICVPEEGSFKLTLLVGTGAPLADFQAGPIFKKARALVPKASLWPATYQFNGDRFRLDLAAKNLSGGSIKSAYFFPYGHGVVKYAAPQKLTVSDRGLTLETQRGKATKPITGLDGLLVIRETLDGRTVTQSFKVTATPSSVGAGLGGAAGSIGLWEAILLALLGGLILNLMPCVLPVLAIKALSFASHAAEGRSMARHGLAYTLGVLVTFGIVAAVLLMIRGAGEAAGWGFQLQEPIFVLLMAYLMFVIGLNFAGLFEFGGRLVGIGGGLAGRSGTSGSFFTGVLAVIVATPCTAPFMGAAVGFALGQPAAVAVAVILALGLGLALPFLLLSLAPWLLRFIPKPGPWMVRFKQLLAFPMFATAAWLVWVLSLQAGEAALLGALAGAILIAFAIWLWQASATSTRFWRPVGIGLAAVAVFAAFSMVRFANDGARATTVAAKGANWEGFSAAKLETYRAEGRPVFVNFTAAWCITCLANEKVTLRLDSVAAAMKKANMVYLKGDWTKRDPVITRYLARFGRSGVPLYVIYPPKGSAQKPMVLPQILTESGMIAAIGKYAVAGKVIRKAEK